MGAGDAFVIEDTGAETARSHTVEADRGLAGTPLLQQGDWSGQWTSPDLTIPNTAPILAGYSDLLRAAVTRPGSFCQFRIGTVNQGINGVSSWGYIRNAGLHNESSRHGVFLDDLTALDELQIREATTLNGQGGILTYDRTAGDARGFWAVELPDNDHLFATLSATEIASGRYGNTPRPIDLGTPSALSEGTFKAIDSFTTDSSQGTTITRSLGDFTIAANKVVLLVASFQVLSDGNDRNTMLIRMDKAGSPYAWIGIYVRTNATMRLSGTFVIPIITGGSSEIIDFSFVDQVEEAIIEIDLQAARVAFFDLTGQDIALLGKKDADITTVVLTPQQISFPVADEIRVDASFTHPAANLTRIQNDTGATITVLAGFQLLGDRSVNTAAQRKQYTCMLRKSGTIIDYMIASEFSRGAQATDDQFATGFTFCAPVELTSGQYLELDVLDIADEIAGDSVVNCTDGAAIHFWAIRIDNFGAPAGAQTPGLMALQRNRTLGRVLRM